MRACCLSPLGVRYLGMGGSVSCVTAPGQFALPPAPCNFTFAQPCPSSTGTQTLSLPTTQLSDGKHTLTLIATDAAGNQSTIASEEITVDNSAPPAPGGLAATPTPTGSSTSGSSGAGRTATATTPKVHVTETLLGRELVVHVTGSASGRIRVGFTGRLKDRIVAAGARTVSLKHGRLTVTFRLGPRTAAHALIRGAHSLTTSRR
jgi:Bacterial Ig-like domain